MKKKKNETWLTALAKLVGRIAVRNEENRLYVANDQSNSWKVGVVQEYAMSHSLAKETPEKCAELSKDFKLGDPYESAERWRREIEEAEMTAKNEREAEERRREKEREEYRRMLGGWWEGCGKDDGSCGCSAFRQTPGCGCSAAESSSC